MSDVATSTTLNSPLVSRVFTTGICGITTSPTSSRSHCDGVNDTVPERGTPVASRYSPVTVTVDRFTGNATGNSSRARRVGRDGGLPLHRVLEVAVALGLHTPQINPGWIPVLRCEPTVQRSSPAAPSQQTEAPPGWADPPPQTGSLPHPS